MRIIEVLKSFVELLISYLFKTIKNPIGLAHCYERISQYKRIYLFIISRRSVMLWSITLIKSLKEVIVWNCWLTKLRICKEIQFDSKDKLGGTETLFGGEMSNSRMGYSDFWLIKNTSLSYFVLHIDLSFLSSWTLNFASGSWTSHWIFALSMYSWFCFLISNSICCFVEK